MKHIYALFLVFICGFSYAQETIKIPDVAFEEALIDLEIDTNGLNGNILVSDAKYVVNLNIDNPIHNKALPKVNSKIKDLTGIEHFKNLKRLNCRDNEITKIDLSKNTMLTFVNCSQNKISEIDVSNSPNLYFLACDINKLTKLKLGQKDKLTELYCNSNNLTELDITQSPILGSMDASSNNLNEIVVNNIFINAIPEGWYKDEKTSYTTSSGVQQSVSTPKVSAPQPTTPVNTVVETPKTTSQPATGNQNMMQAKEQYENFKRLVVAEFDKSIPEEQYLKAIQQELAQKYMLENTELSKWIATYSKVVNLDKATASNINGGNEQFENYKRFVVKEFDKNVLEKQYLATKKAQIKAKYSIDAKELDKWISQHSKAIKVKKIVSQVTDYKSAVNTKKQYEDFKKSVAKEFDKMILEDDLLKRKKTELQRKYNVDAKEIEKWMQEYSGILKLK